MAEWLDNIERRYDLYRGAEVPRDGEPIPDEGWLLWHDVGPLIAEAQRMVTTIASLESVVAAADALVDEVYEGDTLNILDAARAYRVARSRVDGGAGERT